ncbi:GNAT family N-acetyltransferase [Bradyrhizobium sp. USDA 241]|uniref:GNAT family N-acetyltransferase n=1 Tax=Bradyrhizobium sp. USDA 241 TaxID=3377725 RepID=UPI003C712DDE
MISISSARFARRRFGRTLRRLVLLKRTRAERRCWRLISHWLSGAILGAFVRGNLIGVAGFYVSPARRSQHRGHIFTVYVRENGRGKGFGDRLIKELLAHAEARVEQVHLEVLLEATAAIRTYKRNGFEVYGTDPCAVRIGDVTYDKYLMVRKFSH